MSPLEFALLVNHPIPKLIESAHPNFMRVGIWSLSPDNLSAEYQGIRLVSRVT
jgi:hypothetical protein